MVFLATNIKVIIYVLPKIDLNLQSHSTLVLVSTTKEKNNTHGICFILHQNSLSTVHKLRKKVYSLLIWHDASIW